MAGCGCAPGRGCSCGPRVRKCVRKKRVNGVLRCAEYKPVRGAKKRASKGARRVRRNLKGRGASRGSKMFWLDRDWCRGIRKGYPKGYSAKGLKCTRTIAHRGGGWPTTSAAAMRNRESRARRVKWPK